MRFVQRHSEQLSGYARMSQRIGERRDYVQGGGGNTSVKLDETHMAVKASGFRLSDITETNAYTVMDYAAIRAFYYGQEGSEFEDLEKAGSELAKASIIATDALPTLRPSVEAVFHSLLGRFVIHSHSVYANLACCAVEMKEILIEALEGVSFSWGMVPYIDPGVRLSFTIRDELLRVERETGKSPAAIFMQNHGLIVHAESADACLQLHDEVNRRICRLYGISSDAFLNLDLKKYITDRLRAHHYERSFFIDTPLYPDQMVFLIGTLGFGKDNPVAGEIMLDLTTGKIGSAAKEAQTQVVTETIAAVLFIHEHIEQKRYTLSTMEENAKQFIANWESEKYRKSLLEAKT